jgi:hypothetical protein
MENICGRRFSLPVPTGPNRHQLCLSYDVVEARTTSRTNPDPHSAFLSFVRKRIPVLGFKYAQGETKNAKTFVNVDDPG